jgi:hypothetical protein
MIPKDITAEGPYFNESQVSEAKRTEICRTNYSTCEAKWDYMWDYIMRPSLQKQSELKFVPDFIPVIDT